MYRASISHEEQLVATAITMCAEKIESMENGNSMNASLGTTSQTCVRRRSGIGLEITLCTVGRVFSLVTSTAEINVTILPFVIWDLTYIQRQEKPLICL